MDDKNKPWRENCSVDTLSRLDKDVMLDRYKVVLKRRALKTKLG